MKNYLIILLLMIQTLSLVCKSNEMKCIEKYELINKLIENPKDYEIIIRKSEFYSNSIFANDKPISEIFNKDLIPYLLEYKGKCYITYAYEYDSDFYSINYIGGNHELNPKISFIFNKKNGEWYINQVTYGSQYFLFTKDNIFFINNYSKFKPKNKKASFIRTNSSIKASKCLYLNINYNSCEKRNFLNKLLGQPDKIKYNLTNSTFTSNNAKFKKNYNLIYSIIKEYLTKYKKMDIWINYPFPIDNKNIDRFISGKNEKDYIIYRSNLYTKNSDKPGFLTFEFEKEQNQWKLINVSRGTKIYIGQGPNLYYEPFKD